MNSLDRAQMIAQQAHAPQRDKSDAPYIDHCRRVADAVENLDEKIVAWLHDVVEKSRWTLELLSEAGFDADIISAVDALTRRPAEGELSYLERASRNSLARPVKAADIADNLRQCAESGRPTFHYERLQVIFGQIVHANTVQKAASI